jgi:hypothetical protein
MANAQSSWPCIAIGYHSVYPGVKPANSNLCVSKIECIRFVYVNVETVASVCKHYTMKVCRSSAECSASCSEHFAPRERVCGTYSLRRLGVVQSWFSCGGPCWESIIQPEAGRQALLAELCQFI